MMKKNKLLGLGLAFLFVGQVCPAEVRMPAIFSDNMVLQQKSEAAVWGRAAPGEKVRVKGSWDNSWSETVCADKDGKWITKIKTPCAGGPFELAVEGNNSIRFKDVMAGEVWLCSGQSNMSIPMLGGGGNQPIEDGPEEIKKADYPMIRFFTVLPTASAEPLEDFKEVRGWEICSPEKVQHFSAVAYFFGKELFNELKTPVGLIHSSWGGTPAESWICREILDDDEELKIITENFDAALLKWQSDIRKAQSEGKPEPERPVQLPFSPSYLYNGMIKPAIPYCIKGVIWYQGESNAWRAYQYRRLFPALIENWRNDWKIGEFPFYFVQLANYVKHQPDIPLEVEKGEPAEDPWAELREAQLMTLKSVANTGMAVAIDIGEANNIHPAKKREVGQRLALWALAENYGKDTVCSGPIYKTMVTENDKIRISFDYAEGGLVADGDVPEGFAIAGADRKFVWAEAEIEGDNVIVWNDAVREPVGVRYAWATYPFCNLYNKAGLPASPFRTDDWPGITMNNK